MCVHASVHVCIELYFLKCVTMCDFPLCSLFSDSPVLAELQYTDMITNEECREVYDRGFVVGVQRVKSPEIQSKTADVLKKHGFEKESNFLAGKQTQLVPPPCACGVLYSGA